MNKMFLKIISFIIVLSLTTSCSAHEDSNTLISRYIVKSQEFNLPAPQPSSESTYIQLWATNYYIPEFLDQSGDIPLRDINGDELGPLLSLKEWCSSALEGSVKIRFKDGSSKVYNYHDRNDLSPIDCSAHFSIDVSKTKFRPSKTQFGEGTASYKLIPYRTIAADFSFLSPGTIIFIPEARGNRITIGNEVLIHDGYFFVGDRGGAIKDNHIDVFTGIHTDSHFFKWIGHKSDSIFKALIVTDPDIINTLTKLHAKKSI